MSLPRDQFSFCQCRSQQEDEFRAKLEDLGSTWQDLQALRLELAIAQQALPQEHARPQKIAWGSGSDFTTNCPSVAQDSIDLAQHLQSTLDDFNETWEDVRELRQELEFVEQDIRCDLLDEFEREAADLGELIEHMATLEAADDPDRRGGDVHLPDLKIDALRATFSAQRKASADPGTAWPEGVPSLLSPTGADETAQIMQILAEAEATYNDIEVLKMEQSKAEAMQPDSVADILRAEMAALELDVADLNQELEKTQADQSVADDVGDVDGFHVKVTRDVSEIKVDVRAALLGAARDGALVSALGAATSSAGGSAENLRAKVRQALCDGTSSGELRLALHGDMPLAGPDAAASLIVSCPATPASSLDLVAVLVQQVEDASIEALGQASARGSSQASPTASGRGTPYSSLALTGGLITQIQDATLGAFCQLSARGELQATLSASDPGTPGSASRVVPGEVLRHLGVFLPETGPDDQDNVSMAEKVLSDGTSAVCSQISDEALAKNLVKDCQLAVLLDLGQEDGLSGSGIQLDDAAAWADQSVPTAGTLGLQVLLPGGARTDASSVVELDVKTDALEVNVPGAADWLPSSARSDVASQVVVSDTSTEVGVEDVVKRCLEDVVDRLPNMDEDYDVPMATPSAVIPPLRRAAHSEDVAGTSVAGVAAGIPTDLPEVRTVHGEADRSLLTKGQTEPVAVDRRKVLGPLSETSDVLSLRPFSTASSGLAGGFVETCQAAALARVDDTNGQEEEATVRLPLAALDSNIRAGPAATGVFVPDPSLGATETLSIYQTDPSDTAFVLARVLPGAAMSESSSTHSQDSSPSDRHDGLDEQMLSATAVAAADKEVPTMVLGDCGHWPGESTESKADARVGPGQELPTSPLVPAQSLHHLEGTAPAAAAAAEAAGENIVLGALESEAVLSSDDTPRKEAAATAAVAPALASADAVEPENDQAADADVARPHQFAILSLDVAGGSSDMSSLVEVDVTPRDTAVNLVCELEMAALRASQEDANTNNSDGDDMEFAAVDCSRDIDLVLSSAFSTLGQMDDGPEEVEDDETGHVGVGSAAGVAVSAASAAIDGLRGALLHPPSAAHAEEGLGGDRAFPSKRQRVSFCEKTEDGSLVNGGDEDDSTVTSCVGEGRRRRGKRPVKLPARRPQRSGLTPPRPRPREPGAAAGPAGNGPQRPRRPSPQARMHTTEWLAHANTSNEVLLKENAELRAVIQNARKVISGDDASTNEERKEMRVLAQQLVSEPVPPPVSTSFDDLGIHVQDDEALADL